MYYDFEIEGYFELIKGTPIKVTVEGKDSIYIVPVDGTYYIDQKGIRRVK